ncbi:conserved hypothetical protein [Paecilomyces variotii No. 5]|uniref:Uncharacterized protein n=1 Tax=Byssochlamys spectabilis (strain No. 5 / NBRC 109023) TaxID=1356009 RepID=V5FLX4_BYSSN|nr:conserved hypothetical protein [Paecilomyces variotii No. 5]
MARGLFASKPKRSMTDPDVLSRKDLSTAEQLSTKSHSPRDYHGARSRAESEGHDASETGLPRRGWQSASPQLDVPMTEKPEDTLLANPQLNAVADENMIGIALGSPGLPSSCVETPKEYHDQDVAASIKTRDPPQTSLRRKPSKWKKIGSLFKGKQSVPGSRSHFYQVQVSEEEKQNYAFETKLQSESVLRLDVADVKKGGRREEMIQVMQSPQEIQTGFPDQHGSNDQQEWPIISTTTEKPSDHISADPVPFLHVDIPDVHMERYSIMFGNVLGNDQSSRLLARRSKTLDNLSVPTEPSSMPERPNLPRRRATSPPRSTAFPSLPAHPKARKYLDSYTLSHGPSPLSKIKAASMANSAEKLSLEDKDVLSANALQAPDVDASFISSTSIETRSDDIDAAVKLKRRPTKSYVNVNEEPTWEMVTKEDELTTHQPAIPTGPAVQPTPPPTPPKNGLKLSPNSAPSKVERIMPRKGSAPIDSPEEPSPRHFDNNVVNAPTISIARTVSVSTRSRQTLLAESDTGRSRSAERLVNHQPRIPQVVDARRGHRHEKSQLAEIETA